MVGDLPLSLVGWLAALGVCAASFAVGAGPVKRAALFVAAGLLVAQAARLFAPPPWSEVLAFAADSGLLVALTSLAWKPASRWPLILVALQGLIVALDVLRAGEPSLRPSTFLVATSLTSAALLVVLMNTAWRSRRGRGLPS